MAGLEKRVGASVMWGLSWFEGGHLWAIKIQPGDCSAEGMDVSTAWNGAQPAAFSMGMTAGSDPAANAAAAAALRRHCGCAAMEGV